MRPRYVNTCFQEKASKIHSSFICRCHNERVTQFSLTILPPLLNQSEAKLTHSFPRMTPGACLFLMNSTSFQHSRSPLLTFVLARLPHNKFFTVLTDTWSKSLAISALLRSVCRGSYLCLWGGTISCKPSLRVEERRSKIGERKAKDSDRRLVKAVRGEEGVKILRWLPNRQVAW